MREYIVSVLHNSNLEIHGFWPKALQIHGFQKNRVSARLLAKNRVSQVFWDPIKNRVSSRSALLEAVYLKALLYRHSSIYAVNVGTQKNAEAKTL